MVMMFKFNNTLEENEGRRADDGGKHTFGSLWRARPNLSRPDHCRHLSGSSGLPRRRMDRQTEPILSILLGILECVSATVCFLNQDQLSVPFQHAPASRS